MFILAEDQIDAIGPIRAVTWTVSGYVHSLCQWLSASDRALKTM